MSTGLKQDWNPGAYSRFRDLRMRPALDLLNAVGQVGAGDVVDLGCGNGVMSGVLAERFAGHRVVGVDASPAMLDKARGAAGYFKVDEADIASWEADGPVGCIYSNAALHWLGDHDTLFPRLAGMLSRGGTLAVQMPHQNNAPSHRVWWSLVEELFPGVVPPDATPRILAPIAYDEMLAPLGQVRLWETEYYQRLSAEGEGHPVRRFIESTYARPILDALDPDQRSKLITQYDSVMASAYPVRGDGTVLFPFRRLFFTLTL